MDESLARRLAAELFGCLMLGSAVVGSGIMAEPLAAQNLAVALLANTAASVAMLALLINLLGPVSGAHFNPVVSLAMALRRRMEWSTVAAYILVQVLGFIGGTLLAHAMFGLPLLQTSLHARSGMAQMISEVVATCGLVVVVLGHRRSSDAPWLAACWIGAAYWFTASTSFANPAITIARSLTDTFAGIRPIDVPAFIGAQLIGAGCALAVTSALFGRGDRPLLKGARSRAAPNVEQRRRA